MDEAFEQDVARNGAALFTKPISISFDSGSNELSAESISLINQQVLPQLQIAGGMYARVEGNTDSVGDYAMNQALSEQRAAAIVSYLVSRGIPANRLVARGNGFKVSRVTWPAPPRSKRSLPKAKSGVPQSVTVR